MVERTLDWKPQFDPRSLQLFALDDHFNLDAPLRTRRRLHYGEYLDQGHEGACVGFGTANSLAVTPTRVRTMNNTLARDIYLMAQTLDEYPGEAYEGTSVLAGMKAAKEKGYISAYYWATTLEQVKHAVSSDLGAMVIGVNWYTGMFHPDANGFLQPTDGVAGGHCVTLTGIDLVRGAFILQNSWGQAWGGVGGAKPSQAFLAFDVAERLLIAEGGEAALMRKVA